MSGCWLLSTITNPQVTKIRMHDNLDFVMGEFTKKNLDELPVVSESDSNKVVGLITMHAAMAAYNHELLKLEAHFRRK